MKTKGLLEGNRALMAQNAYIQGISRFSWFRPRVEKGPNMGTFRGISVHFSANFQQIKHG
jgi:hypothetical protein